jgi:dTDP-4-dehydrorhamnose reductase
VGKALLQAPPADAQLQAFTHSQLDICDATAVQRAIEDLQPQVVINAAAYTAVDRAEDEPEQAEAINAHGAANLAHAVRAVPGCRLLHISTDYVFDGRSAQSYRTDDATNPVSVYGRTKLQGEIAVRETLGERAAVLRTAWVYAAQGKNFLLTMLRLMRERGAVRVVGDQRGSPTTADSIAGALWRIAQRPDVHGILHWTDAGADTWFGFASAIAQEAHAAGLLTTLPTVTAITTAEYPTRAQRPANSVLDTASTIALLRLTPSPWRTNLRSTLEKIDRS